MGALGSAPAPPGVAPARITFVGNSLTYFNGGVYKELARVAPAGAVVAVDDVTQGGAPLALLAGRAVAHLAGEGGADDAGKDDARRVLVLQEDMPETTPPEFRAAAARIAAAARERGWEVVLMACWPYDTGGRTGTTVYSDTMVIKEHRRVGASIGARVAPAGLAKLRCEAALPGVALLAEDGEHPSAALTHVQARCVCGAVFGRAAAAACKRPRAACGLDAAQTDALIAAVDDALAAEEDAAREE